VSNIYDNYSSSILNNMFGFENSFEFLLQLEKTSKLNM
jgi:hypothetical protein